MLFQPTNIFPSSRGGLGNGTIDATQDLVVSWQVNGNSSMVAFQIVIYKNDTASTQVYSTGKLTDGTPFYGTNYAGNVQFFTYAIPASALSSAGITNGNEYKLVITQWWGATDEQSVTQTSAAAFITRSTPVLTLDNVPDTMAARDYTFTASYEQAQGDTLNWIRWQIAFADDTANPFYDTQNIYGTAQLQTYYDGFFRGNEYAVRVRIQTENGIEADTGWVSFAVEFDSNPLSGIVKASKVVGGRSAVLVEWPAISYIPGTATGDYTITDNVLSLPVGSSVVWDSANNEPMDFPSPWTLIMRGKLVNATSTPLVITTTNGTIEVSYDYYEKLFSISSNGNAIITETSFVPDREFTIIVTPTTIYLRYLMFGGGLYPGETLYPSASLFPARDVEPVVIKVSAAIPGEQGAITSIEIAGPTTFDYITVLNGVLSQQEMDSAYIDGTYTPAYGENTLLRVDFTDELQGGNLGQTDDALVGLAIYRQQSDDRVLQHIIDLPLATGAILDYGTASQQGPYTYYLFPVGASTYISDPIASNKVNPCFWNWTILECSQRGDGSYVVDAEYTFANNVSSGSVSNNNSPNVLRNFTPYPTVQLDNANYMSGTLKSLIGVVDYTGGQNEYSDSISLRNAIFALSVSRKTLLLKNRKGDFIEIKVSGSVSMETWDNSRQQAQTMSLPWVEIGSAENYSVVVTPSDAMYPDNIPTVPPSSGGDSPIVGGTATAADILVGKTAVVNGVLITGTMPDNGRIEKSIDGLSFTSTDIPKGYTSGGTVSLTDDIENALEEV